MTYPMRTREGNRGGQGDFQWEDVKAEHYRENYLGHSLYAPVGRWQKGKDLQWYSRNETKASKSSVDSHKRQLIDKEREMVRNREQEILAEALGLGQARRFGTESLTQLDILEVCKRKAGDDEFESSFDTADRVSGLGFRGGEIAALEKKVQSKGLTTFEGPTAKDKELALRKPQHDSDEEYVETTQVKSKKKKSKEKKHKKEKKKKRKSRRRHDSSDEEEDYRRYNDRRPRSRSPYRSRRERSRSRSPNRRR